MAQSKPFRRIAIVVEVDPIQREMIALLLEESDFSVVQCEDAETASLALKVLGRGRTPPAPSPLAPCLSQNPPNRP